MTYLYNALSNLLRMTITLCSTTQSVDHFLKWKQGNLKYENGRNITVKGHITWPLRSPNTMGIFFREKCRYQVNYKLPIFFIKNYIVVSETKLLISELWSAAQPQCILFLTSNSHLDKIADSALVACSLILNWGWTSNEKMTEWTDDMMKSGRADNAVKPNWKTRTKC